jgi:hypothetical protein
MVLVYDHLLEEKDFQDYLNRLKFARFSDVISQGQKYSDMSQDLGGEKIYKILEKNIGFKPVNVINFLRAYVNRPEYRHPMWIHSDVLFADYIAVFFVQASEFSQDDGFSLWKNKELNDIQLYTKDHTDEKNKIVDSQTLDPDKWELWKRVEFKPNRIVICPASYFHSTTTYGHAGGTLDNCRIVHVLFFNKEKDNV